MNKVENEHSKILQEIIEICTCWKKHIEEKTSIGNELVKEFERQDIIDILSGMF